MPEIEVTTSHAEASPRWLGLGSKIDAKSIEEVLSQGNLHWTVSKRPIATPRGELYRSDGIKVPPPLSGNGMDIHTDILAAIDSILEHPETIETKTTQDGLRILRDAAQDCFITSKEHFAIVRDDTEAILGTAGKRYTCLTNEECLGVLGDLIETGKVEVERVGEFNHGANVWVVAKLPGSLEVGPDILDQYIRIGWSHDGTEKLSANFIAYLRRGGVVLNPKLPGARISVGIRHTSNAKERVKIAAQLLTHGENYFAKMEEVFEDLINSAFNENEMEAYLGAVFPQPKEAKRNSDGSERKDRGAQHRERVMEIFQDSDTAFAGTRWAAYTAVAQWADHERPTKIHGKDEMTSAEEVETKEKETRLQGIWTGNASTRKEAAFAALIGS